MAESGIPEAPKPSAQDVTLAEKLIRRRSRATTILAVFFLMFLAKSLSVDMPARGVDFLRLAALLVWAAVLLLLLVSGGGLLRTSAVRGLLNDENTHANRQRAFVAGFWATVLCAFALYPISFFEPITARQAIRILLSVAVAAALLRFGQLERNALRSG